MSQKKPYQKPAMVQVKLALEEQILTACRSAARSTNTSRCAGRACSRCRVTYSRS
ncbi:MAG: hypothetical protein HZB91_04660 [Elusimicrobia bacterium]|nr:hypothetical protein [Elusimicrobiota bacterium]